MRSVRSTPSGRCSPHPGAEWRVQARRRGRQPLPADSVLDPGPGLDQPACAMALQVARDNLSRRASRPRWSQRWTPAGRPCNQGVCWSFQRWSISRWHAWPVLEDLIAAGGPVLFFRRDPFAARVFQADGAWHTQAELYAQVIAAASADNACPHVQTWRHGNDSGRLRGAVKVAHGAGLPWPGFARWRSRISSNGTR
jgi:hypothetical protein